MLSIRLALLFFLALCLGSGCGSDATGGACAGVVHQGIEVEIRDSLTGTPLAAAATALATEGTIVDTLYPAGFDTTATLLTLAGVPERPGTYTVDVDAPGYIHWTRAGVEVRDGVCGVKTTHLLALLQLAP